MITYQVTVTREDGLWVADIGGPNLGPAATDAAHFADLNTEVRDLIAGLTGTEPDAFGLAWRYVINGTDVTAAVADLVEAESKLYVTRAREAARVEVLRALSSAKLPQSAMGDILGVSHQRVHQLLRAS